MASTKKEKKKLCFVVGPIGDDTSDDRIHADWLLEEIIVKVFDEHYPDFEVMRADKYSDPGRIDAQVITALLDAELVIADLTTLNPNAFYEIGIRHTIQKPIIHMHLEGQRIPFDIASFRSIKFQRTWPRDLQTARHTLKQFVDAALADGHQVDNPVTFSRGRIQVSDNAAPEDKVILSEIDALNERLYSMEYVVSAIADQNNGDLYFGPRDVAKKNKDRIHIRSNVESPEVDVQSLLRPLISRVQNADLRTLSRTEAYLTLPKNPMIEKFITSLQSIMGDQYDVTLMNEGIFG